MDNGERAHETESPPNVPAEILQQLKDAGFNTSDPKTADIVSITLSFAFRGPLPPAEMLAAYEVVRKGSADDIFDQFTRQSEHRRELELRRVKGSERRQILSQLYTFVVSVLGLSLAAAVAYFGNNGWATTAAIAIATVAFGGPGAATVLSRWIAKQDQ